MSTVSSEHPGVVVDPPLRGEWVALHTPGERVPSHGTDYLGQRYAYDFVRWAPEADLPYESGLLRHLFGVQPAESFVCWDEPVYSVFDGEVTEAGDGRADRLRVNLLCGLVSSGLFPPDATEDDLRPLAGNYAIVEGDAAVAFYAHLREGSLAIRPRDRVRAGDLLGRVGNSGNSTMPHLHFHLMDRPEIRSAEGVLCRFRALDQLEDGEWKRLADGVPDALKRIRWDAAGRGLADP